MKDPGESRPVREDVMLAPYVLKALLERAIIPSFRKMMDNRDSSKFMKQTRMMSIFKVRVRLVFTLYSY